ncbi:hypothetical protein BKA67DRAFT_534706 [Truncatella angustata]|uniref:Uncharacterized protein n=1 Tax=Truncatella angustata TaxID=152316 RepID=A0A9P8UPE1_9PEZI|nr:uncharacterized protein BKA67DRAFT_534706 [Truncatella angustata]KAH6655797.1 hypothetical protein BKA67DRAFT_534706 [Truncatella angustata]KAH8199385.1 hypothetical protein TruAng_006429 [Truncatella angustata]
MGAAPSRLIRISTTTGAYTDLRSLNLTSTPVAGVVDENSQYWLTNAANTAWTQVDLLPGSATFGRIVASGTSPAPAYTVSDWAWIPGTAGGNYLWGVSYEAGLLGLTGTSRLMAWNRSTKIWTTSTAITGVLSGSLINYQSVFAGGTDTLYAADSSTGQLYTFPLPGSGLATAQVALGNSFGLATIADGARCAAAN